MMRGGLSSPTEGSPQVAMVNRERLLKTFLDLVAIDGVSLHEGAVAEAVEQRLCRLGLEPFRDQAGAAIGGETGNVIAALPGALSATVLLVAHLDTIRPTGGVVIVQQEGAVRSDGTAILGADDRAGVAMVLEAVEVLRESETPHPTVEVAFTVAEEIGLLGAKHLDYQRLKARVGFVADGGKEVETVVSAGPWHSRFAVKVIGRAAHAAVHPEEGVNAVLIASRAIAQMRLGKVDEETVANVGVIRGGEATNVVPAEVEVKGEARSQDPSKVGATIAEMVGLFEREAEAAGGRAESSVEELYQGYRHGPESEVIRIIEGAMARQGLTIQLKPSAGGTDANFLNAGGIASAVVPTGAHNPHSNEEALFLDEFYRSAQLLVDIVLEAGEVLRAGR